jgi:amidophosphoribosyltransferase
MKEKFLVYGSNTSFNKRACDILRRHYDVLELDINFKYNESGSFCVDIPTSYTLRSYISFHRIDYFLFSTDHLLFIKDKEEFIKFFDLIKSIKKKFNHVTFILVSFQESGILNERISLIGNKFYKENYEILLLYCKRSNWLVFNNENYITNITADYQKNPLEFDDKSIDFLVGVHVDDIVAQIIQHLGNNEVSLLKVKTHKFNVNHYKKIRRALYDDLISDMDFDQSSIESVIAHQKECAVEVLYRKSPGEKVNNRIVADLRFEMGSILFGQVPDDIAKKLQLIIPVPETGKYYAQGFAAASKISYVEALYKRTDMGRSFDIADTENRKLFLNKKLGIYPDLVANKTVGIIDEAIFTGSTLKIVVHLLKSASVNEVYLFIPSPICRSQCAFNMQPRRSMLASYVALENIAAYFNVNGVFFQETRTFQNSMYESGHACIKCFK